MEMAVAGQDTTVLVDVSSLFHVTSFSRPLLLRLAQAVKNKETVTPDDALIFSVYFGTEGCISSYHREIFHGIPRLRVLYVAEGAAAGYVVCNSYSEKLIKL